MTKPRNGWFMLPVMPALGLMMAPVFGQPTFTLAQGKLLVCLYPGCAPCAEKQVDGSWTGWDIYYLKPFARSATLSF